MGLGLLFGGRRFLDRLPGGDRIELLVNISPDLTLAIVWCKIRTMARLCGHATIQMSTRYVPTSARITTSLPSNGWLTSDWRGHQSGHRENAQKRGRKCLVMKCESGEIGRRTRLRIWRSNPWGFKSPLSHQFFLTDATPSGDRVLVVTLSSHNLLSCIEL
jgi:hypothetical protein